MQEANGKIFVDERTLWPSGDFVTAQIIVNPDYLQKNPEIIKKLLRAHIDETNWINRHQDDAVQAFNIELQKLTGKTIPTDEFKAGLSRLKLTYDPIKSSLYKSANDAFNLGFLGDIKPDLSKIYDLTILNQVLKESNLPEIK